jgi:hypothetical protein
MENKKEENKDQSNMNEDNKENKTKVSNWILHIAQKVNHLEVKDMNDALNNVPFLFALIKYYSPESIRSNKNQNLENLIEIFNSLLLKGENMEELLFGAFELFTNSYYQERVIQRQIDV